MYDSCVIPRGEIVPTIQVTDLYGHRCHDWHVENEVVPQDLLFLVVIRDARTIAGTTNEQGEERGCLSNRHGLWLLVIGQKFQQPVKR